MEQITIAGHTFNVPVRYEEGHELTAGEASALNQTYHENLRNNFAKSVKESAEANGGSADLAALQAKLDAYAAEYQFGVRTGGGGGTRDPVMSEAMRIAKAKVGQLIKASGKNPRDYTNEAISGAAKALIERDGSIMEEAKRRVEEQRSIAAAGMEDILAGLTPKPPEAPSEGQAQDGAGPQA